MFFWIAYLVIAVVVGAITFEIANWLDGGTGSPGKNYADLFPAVGIGIMWPIAMFALAFLVLFIGSILMLHWAAGAAWRRLNQSSENSPTDYWVV